LLYHIIVLALVITVFTKNTCMHSLVVRFLKFEI